MSVKKTIEIVKIQKESISKATCDHCSQPLNSVTLMKQTALSTYQELDDRGIDGLNINFTAGYGSEYDMRKIEITLCTVCLVKMVTQFGGIIK